MVEIARPFLQTSEANGQKQVDAWEWQGIHPGLLCRGANRAVHYGIKISTRGKLEIISLPRIGHKSDQVKHRRPLIDIGLRKKREWNELLIVLWGTRRDSLFCTSVRLRCLGGIGVPNNASMGIC